MTNIDASVKFVSINIALLTISDSRSENEDESGDLLNERITNFGHSVKERLIIKDDVALIKQTFLDLSNDPAIDVIISTGAHSKWFKIFISKFYFIGSNYWCFIMAIIF